MKRLKQLFINLSLITILLLGMYVYTACRISYSSDANYTNETTCESNSVSPNIALSYNNEPLNGPYEVVRVIDGDTIIVNIDGESTRVRLIGIDCPESVNPNEELNTPEGLIASERTKTLISAADYLVYLEYDEELTDNYDRLLAYVYIYDQDGSYNLPSSYMMIEEILLREGLADVIAIEPNTSYEEFFRSLVE